MDFAFPQMVWLRFYKSKFSTEAYLSKLVRNTKMVRKNILSARDDGSSYMEVYLYNDTKIYSGGLDEEKVINELSNYYEDELFPMFKADAYIGTDDFMNNIIKFLLMAKESMKYTDEYEKTKVDKEVEKINKCIDAIKTIKRI